MTTAAATRRLRSRWKRCSRSDPARQENSPQLLRSYPMNSRRIFLGGVAAAAALSFSFSAQAAEGTIKIGVLHSLSGTMAISETTLKDTMLMLIDEQNKKGGVLGKKLEAVVVDPASNWPLFA